MKLLNAKLIAVFFLVFHFQSLTHFSVALDDFEIGNDFLRDMEEKFGSSGFDSDFSNSDDAQSYINHSIPSNQDSFFSTNQNEKVIEPQSPSFQESEKEENMNILDKISSVNGLKQNDLKLDPFKGKDELKFENQQEQGMPTTPLNQKILFENNIESAKSLDIDSDSTQWNKESGSQISNPISEDMQLQDSSQDRIEEMNPPIPEISQDTKFQNSNQRVSQKIEGLNDIESQKIDLIGTQKEDLFESPNPFLENHKVNLEKKSSSKESKVLFNKKDSKYNGLNNDLSLDSKNQTTSSLKNLRLDTENLEEVDNFVPEFAKPLPPNSIETQNIMPRNVYSYNKLHKNRAKKNLAIGNKFDSSQIKNQSEYSKYLFTAVTSENIGGIKALLDKGAHINIKDSSYGRTPLIAAVISEKSSAVRYLIVKGADINAVSFSGKTALHYAVMRQNIEIIKVLLSAGADINILDNNEKIAFQYARDTRIGFEMLSQYSNIDEGLWSCSFYGVIPCVKLAISKGGNTDTMINNQTPLMLAVLNNNQKLLEVLLRGGANTSIKNKENKDIFDLIRQSDNLKLLDVIETIKIQKQLEEDLDIKTQKESLKPKSLIQRYHLD